MSWNLSTGAANAIAGLAATTRVALTATTISFGDGTGSGSPARDQILDSGNGLAVFADYVHDSITVDGSTSNNVSSPILTVAAGAIEIAAGVLATEVAGDQVILTVARGGCIAEVFRNFTAYIYSGTRPASADLAETGTLLCKLTKNGGTFVSGSPTNGLNFIQSGDRTLILATDPATGTYEAVQGTGLATADAYFIRIYANTVVQGDSTSAIRMDGRISTDENNAELVLRGSSRITLDVPVDLTESLCSITL